MTELRDGTIRLPKKAAKVRSKAPASVQITAEQLLREAKERDLEAVAQPPRRKIVDQAELNEIQLRKRKEFEDALRKNRAAITNWIKYAKWEEGQGELQRSRSVFERGIDIDHRCVSLWLQYAELEMRNRQVNHARNIWNRAVQLMPRANQFWYKYAYMEEMLGNVAGARQVFERWMEWEPDEQAWLTYINFEHRYKEIERVRNIYQQFLHVHPDVKNWIRYAKFEERFGSVSAARQVFEQAVDFFGDDDMDEKLMLGFAKFEENQKEHDRARVIYKYALEHLSETRRPEVYKRYTIHEKKYGDRPEIENVVFNKRKNEYEKQITTNPFNYDAWFDYIRLLEAQPRDDYEKVIESIRYAYECAIANVPPKKEKRLWRRYLYLWLNYALFEELDQHDIQRTREIYKLCLSVIPHATFTFSKMWIWAAKFEIRQKDLQAARKIMGNAIGRCPKDKSFREYINMELELREFDRCRELYKKWLMHSPTNCTTWVKFAEMEELLGEMDRARALFELAVEQQQLDMPEVLWKAYIDFETREEEVDHVRKLYERLLDKTQHVKVWLSYAKFEWEQQEASTASEVDRAEHARAVYRRAHRELADSQNEDKQSRTMLVESWKKFEDEFGTTETQAEVSKEMPRRVKKRRPIVTADGYEAGMEEYYDYIFPSDESSQSILTLLAKAKQWKQQQQQEEEDEDGGRQEVEDMEADDVEKVREGDSDTDLSEESDDEEEGGGKDKGDDENE